MTANATNERVAAIVRALPQFKRIAPDDVKKWINATLASDPDPARLLWALDRQGAGFGGSETGTLVLDAIGRKSPYGNSETLINQKLFRALPQPDTWAMKRGRTLERIGIEAALKLYGGKFLQEEKETLKKITGNEPSGLSGEMDFPWETETEERILADIKVPLGGKYIPNSEVDFLYCTQLNHYDLLGQAKGLKPYDKLVNIYLELPEAIGDYYTNRILNGGEESFQKVLMEAIPLLAENKPGMRLNLQEKPINPVIETPWGPQPLNDLIKSIGELSWECVLEGEAPQRNPSATQLNEEQLTALAAEEEKLEKLEAMSRVIESQRNTTEEKIASIIGSTQLQGSVSAREHCSTSTKVTIDQTKLKNIIQRYNIDDNSLRHTIDPNDAAPGDYDINKLIEFASANPKFEPSLALKPGRYDESKVSQCLNEKGENISSLLNVNVKTSIKRTKNAKNHLNEIADSLLPDISDLLENQLPQTHESSEDNDLTISMDR